MRKESKLKLFIRTETQIGEEKAEPQRFINTASLSEERGEYALCYAEGEGDELSRVSLLFEEENRHELRMRREGATEAEMYFAGGVEHKLLYTVRGAGVLPLKICTKQVENTLTRMGGRIKLVYEIENGGVRQQNTLELTAKPLGEGE